MSCSALINDYTGHTCDDEYDDDTQYKYDRDAGMIDHVDYFLH